MPEVQEQQEGQNEEQRGSQDEHRRSERESRLKKSGDPRRKRAIRFIILALVVVGIIIAIPIYAYYSVRESTDDAQVDGHVVPISPRVSGTILSVLVNDNQQVKAGQELVRLDPADYQVALEQAKARLATAQANTVESSANVPLTNINTRSQVSTSASQLEESQAAVAAAQQAVRILDALVIILPLITLALLVATIWLSVNRRRTLIELGIGEPMLFHQPTQTSVGEILPARASCQ